MKINISFEEYGSSIHIFSIKGNYIGLISKYKDSHLFVGDEWIKDILKDDHKFRGSAILIEGSLEDVKEVIRASVDYYINQFLEE